jgi:hypothetical protein
MWKVGQVMRVGVGDGAFGYGFNVTTSRNQPLILFAYETREAAEPAAQQVETAVERAVLVRPFPLGRGGGGAARGPQRLRGSNPQLTSLRWRRAKARRPAHAAARPGWQRAAPMK